MDILTGRRATEGHEPRQVRKEAAISDIICVVDRSRLCNIYDTLSASRFFCIFISISRFSPTFCPIPLISYFGNDAVDP